MFVALLPNGAPFVCLVFFFLGGGEGVLFKLNQSKKDSDLFPHGHRAFDGHCYGKLRPADRYQMLCLNEGSCFKRRTYTSCLHTSCIHIYIYYVCIYIYVHVCMYIYIYMLTPPCMTYLLARKSRISSIICPSLHRYWWGTALGFHCTREQNTKLIIFNSY